MRVSLAFIFCSNFSTLVTSDTTFEGTNSTLPPIPLPEPDWNNIIRPFNYHETFDTEHIPKVNTTYGEVTGTRRILKLDHRSKEFTLKIHGSVELESFYQIPYAAPPKRFEKAKRHGGFGVQGFDASTHKSGIDCDKTEIDQYGNSCLRLSVHRPKPDRNGNYLKKAAMIYIHGGGYSMGSAEGTISIGNNNQYEPAALVSEGDIVFVSLNYRLNAQGGLDTIGEKNKNFSVKGNFYLHDVNLAIDWVLENAEEFGIDTDKITVSGQSCGGPLASWTSVLPTLQGKIHRLYTISGNLASIYSGKNKFGKGSNFDTTRQLASMNHCLNPDSEEMISCIKSKSFDDLRQLSFTNITWRPSFDEELR